MRLRSTPGQVLCYNAGTPQGGPLPGTAEWVNGFCPKKVQAVPLQEVASPAVVSPFIGLQVARFGGGEVASMSAVVPTMHFAATSTQFSLSENNASLGFDQVYAQALCVDPAAQGQYNDHQPPLAVATFVEFTPTAFTVSTKGDMLPRAHWHHRALPPLCVWACCRQRFALCPDASSSSS